MLILTHTHIHEAQGLKNSIFERWNTENEHKTHQKIQSTVNKKESTDKVSVSPTVQIKNYVELMENNIQHKYDGLNKNLVINRAFFQFIWN